MKAFLWCVYFIYLLLVIIACFVPDLIEMGFHTDKMMHITFVCLAIIWPCICIEKWRYTLLFCGLILMGGLCVEVLQGLTPDRKTEWEDIGANIAGIAIGLLIGALLRSGYRAAPRQ